MAKRTRDAGTAKGADFNSSFNAHYWSPAKDTAEREWAARHWPGSDTCLIQIQVSNAFIERLRSVAIWFSADWKEFVWTCKQEMEPPLKFDYLRDVDLIKGYICSGMSRPAIQWMFWKPETLKRVEEEIRGKMHIEILSG